MTAADAGRILAHLRDRRKEMVELLGELVSLESPSTVPESQAPLFDRISSLLRALDFEVRLSPGESSGGYLEARPPGHRADRPFQLLLGHVDTVWPLGTLERMPLRVEGDVVRGPGAFDMKGGVAQMIFALRALNAAGIVPEVAPVVFLSSDEEVGGAESLGRIAELSRGADRALLPEPALGEEGRLKTARRGVGVFEVRARGKKAHVGLDPESGVNAILEMAHVVRALHRLNDPERGVGLNVGRVEGGTQVNVVPSECRAEVDLRIWSVAEGERVERAIRELAPTLEGAGLEVRGGLNRPPMERTPRNQALWRAARAAGRLLGLELEEGASGGASDGNITSRHTATLDGLGAVGDGAHADHEFVYSARMPERAALLALILALPPLPRLEP